MTTNEITNFALALLSIAGIGTIYAGVRLIVGIQRDINKKHSGPAKG